MPAGSWECFKPIIFYLIILKRFQIVSFWQTWSDFHNLYRPPIHITDFLSLFPSYPFCSVIMHCFFSPQWLPVRLHFCQREGFSGLYILHVQVSVKFFGVFFEHLILDILGFPLFLSSDALGFGLHFLLHCLCQLANSPAFVTLFSPIPVEFSIIRVCLSFSYYW